MRNRFLARATRSALPAGVLALCLGVVASAPALAAEEIRLQPRYAPGDAYLLSLRVTTDTEALSRGSSDKNAEEKVQVAYDAWVTVREVDAAGRPTREWHDDVHVSYERPGETGSLSREPMRFEVLRGEDGSLQIRTGSWRLDRKVEKTLAGILAGQFALAGEPELLGPGRPVEIGETWTLDPALAKRWLRERGVRVIRFGAPATATLLRQGGEDVHGELLLYYRIPVARFELVRMPENTMTSRSDGLVEGRVRLTATTATSREPVVRASDLTLSMEGVVLKHGVATPASWNLRSTTRSTQRLVRVDPTGQGIQVSEHGLR